MLTKQTITCILAAGNSFICKKRNYTEQTVIKEPFPLDPIRVMNPQRCWMMTCSMFQVAIMLMFANR